MGLKVSLSKSISLSLMIVSLLCFFNGMMKLFEMGVVMVEWSIMSLMSVSVSFVMIFDYISMIFIGFVLLISSSVVYYSNSYMEGDNTLDRFVYLVLLFVISMVLMIMSPNLVSILLGWDGLGLVSYILVIYYQNEKSYNSGMLTVLSNRVGDVGLLFSIGIMFNFGGWNGFMFDFFFLKNLDLILLNSFILLAALTKSAQMPFSAWLPAAMAAPTPVSALVHSSTLVTAGVYLVIRYSMVLEGSFTQIMLLFISCMTMFMSGLSANYEYDLKKIIALSTLSQLGIMLSMIGLGFYDLAFFHLLSHALFKALLFMCAGVVIHCMDGCQDIRFMGNLVKFAPISGAFFVLANMSLCGLPFLSGFYSKDLILEVVLMSDLNFVLFFLFMLSTGLTVSYTVRVLVYTMTDVYKGKSFNFVQDEISVSNLSMIFLGGGAIAGGCFLSWCMYPEPYLICMDFFLKNIILLIVVTGGGLGYLLNMLSGVSGKNIVSNKIMFFGSMWFLPKLSTFYMSSKVLNMGKLYEVVGDKGWYEWFGGQGLYFVFSIMFNYLFVFNNNNIKIFLKMILFSIVLLIFCLLFNI